MGHSIGFALLKASNVVEFQLCILLYCGTLCNRHSCYISKPTLVGISKTSLDNSLGLGQYRNEILKIKFIQKGPMCIIPEQIGENPNFKLILVVKEWPTISGL